MAKILTRNGKQEV